jgi:lysophospholipase L1-like esterase
MTKTKKYIIIAIVVLLISCLIGLMISGAIWGIPPFGFLYDIRLASLEGNSVKYDIENVKTEDNSSLEGLNILYIGSSVTNGAASQGVSFADYIAKRNNTEYVKEAVNGTTLVSGKNSYIERLQNIDTNQSFDLVICQLSTNDATKGKPLGNPSLTDNPDKDTVCGAIEYIITYVKETWGCPIIFYTNSHYESENYADMVDALLEISELYDVGVIDLYTDADFNSISEEQRKLYMADNIHPTKAGYLEWWTPKIEAYIVDYLSR